MSIREELKKIDAALMAIDGAIEAGETRAYAQGRAAGKADAMQIPEREIRELITRHFNDPAPIDDGGSDAVYVLKDIERLLDEPRTGALQAAKDALALVREATSEHEYTEAVELLLEAIDEL